MTTFMDGVGVSVIFAAALGCTAGMFYAIGVSVTNSEWHQRLCDRGLGWMDGFRKDIFRWGSKPSDTDLEDSSG